MNNVDYSKIFGKTEMRKMQKRSVAPYSVYRVQTWCWNAATFLNSGSWEFDWNGSADATMFFDFWMKEVDETEKEALDEPWNISITNSSPPNAATTPRGFHSLTRTRQRYEYSSRSASYLWLIRVTKTMRKMNRRDCPKVIRQIYLKMSYHGRNQNLPKVRE